MLGERPNNDQLLLIVVEVVNSQQVFYVVADAQMVVQRTLGWFPLEIRKVLDFIFFRESINCNCTNATCVKRAAVFFGAARFGNIVRQIGIAALPVICCKIVKRIADQADACAFGRFVAKFVNGLRMEHIRNRL